MLKKLILRLMKPEIDRIIIELTSDFDKQIDSFESMMASMRSDLEEKIEDLESRLSDAEYNIEDFDLDQIKDNVQDHEDRLESLREDHDNLNDQVNDDLVTNQDFDQYKAHVEKTYVEKPVEEKKEG